MQIHFRIIGEGICDTRDGACWSGLSRRGSRWCAQPRKLGIIRYDDGRTTAARLNPRLLPFPVPFARFGPVLVFILVPAVCG